MMKTYIFIFTALLLLSSPVHSESFPAVAVYQDASPAVVLVDSSFGGKGSLVGAGSILTDTGIVITNAHTVFSKKESKQSTNIRIFLKPERVTSDINRILRDGYKAEIVVLDSDLDLAILQIIDFQRVAKKILLANPDEMKIGEEVVAIGHPEQGRFWSLSYGIISGEIRNYSGIAGRDVFQTDANINRGNSGGPLLDRRGYMVGINTNIARLSQDNMPITGVNFALKSSVVKKWLQQQGIIIPYGREPLYTRDVKTNAERMSMRTPAEKADNAVLTQDENRQTPPDKKSLALAAPEVKADTRDLPSSQGDILTLPETEYIATGLLKDAETEMEKVIVDLKTKVRKK